MLPYSLFALLFRAVMLRGTTGFVLDGAWHHIAISVSNSPSTSPYMVFIDGEPWDPDLADSAWFLKKGISVGGALNLGWLESMGEGESESLGGLCAK